jgi:uncharacterized protein DUF5946
VWGATYSTDETCEDRFNASQAQEFTGPAYFAVHQLSVPCFMLQHNRYSRDGWISVRQVLVRFLHGLTSQEAREESRMAGGEEAQPSIVTCPVALCLLYLRD